MTDANDRYAIPTLAGLKDQAVVIQVGGTELGIRVTLVREVLNVPSITRLPFPDPAIPGLISVRGAILPLLDLGVRLFRIPANRSGRVVIVETDATGEIALLVDAVVDLVPVTPMEEIEAEIGESLPSGWIETVTSPREDRLVTVLNLSPVLARGTSPESIR